MSELAQHVRNEATRPAGEEAEALRALALSMALSMPVERRIPFALAVTRGVPYRDIAQSLGITDDTIQLDLQDGLVDLYQEVIAQAGTIGIPRSINDLC